MKKKKVKIQKYGKRSVHPDTAEGHRILDAMDDYILCQVSAVAQQVKRGKSCR